MALPEAQHRLDRTELAQRAKDVFAFLPDDVDDINMQELWVQLNTHLENHGLKKDVETRNEQVSFEVTAPCWIFGVNVRAQPELARLMEAKHSCVKIGTNFPASESAVNFDFVPLLNALHVLRVKNGRRLEC